MFTVLFYSTNCGQCTEDVILDLSPQYDFVRSVQDRMMGLGDLIKRITSWFGIPHCNGCALRRNKLNQLFPSKYAKSLDLFTRKCILEAQRSKIGSYPFLASVNSEGEIEIRRPDDKHS